MFVMDSQCCLCMAFFSSNFLLISSSRERELVRMGVSLLGTYESRAKRLLICQKPKESNSIEVAIQLIIERSLVRDGPNSGMEHT